MFTHGETVTVLTAGTATNPYSGQPDSENWATATSTDVDNVAVEPRPSSEPTQDARNASTSGFTLYMPPDASVTSKNRVTVRGRTYRVDGEPALWSNPFTGWTPGLVVQTEATEG